MQPRYILEDIGLKVCDIDSECIGNTRDCPTIGAYRDKTGVIYLDQDCGHDYSVPAGIERKTMMRVDDNRRARQFANLFVDKIGLDFGCGEFFNFGWRVSLNARHGRCFGVDPCIEGIGLETKGAASSIEELKKKNTDIKSFDIVTMFHVVEHLSDPIETLREVYDNMTPGGTLIVEIPNAKDWLMTNVEAFRKFSLWSQHLILHTRDSISRLLMKSGFSIDRIESFQRYPHSNHVHWMLQGKPGCYEVNEALDKEYANYLAKRDETDTLIAFAYKQK